MDNKEYAGFWIRVGASLIDTVLMLLIISPLLLLIYGNTYWLDERLIKGSWDFILNHIAPAIVVIIFWVYKSATPGKMILDLTIIDAKTGGKPSTAQFIGRYLAYFVAVIPFLLGIIWVGFDKKKQGWHDKLAGTLVVKQS
jgi:uncharacterized RDD family membrane protein YckC